MSSLITLVRQWLQEASEQMQTPVTLPLGLLLGVPAVLLVIWLIWHRHHQQALAAKAWLMNEAVRNEDLAFRLSARGLCKGERALLDSLNNMGHEIGILMDRHEVESWQKLTRVLTHEIMNTVTPINSISQAYLSRPDIQGTVYEEGLRAIHDTGSGLIAFIDSYRKLTQLQEAQPCRMAVSDLIDAVRTLYPQLHWQVRLPHGLAVHADKNMLRQVLVNLVKNAAEAGAGTIDIRWDAALLVSNDGHFISAETAREIFIPFFTTKRNGSGIGLSLSRQLMVAQGGDLRLADVPASGWHVTFVIVFEQSASSGR